MVGMRFTKKHNRPKSKFSASAQKRLQRMPNNKMITEITKYFTFSIKEKAFRPSQFV